MRYTLYIDMRSATLSPTTGEQAPGGSASDASLEIADLFALVGRRLRRGTSEALAPLGLAQAQGRVVRLLADGPLRMAAIAERLSVVPRTVTDLVDGVEAAGLVERQADPVDRRSTLVALTPAGHRLLDRLDVARRESAEATFGRLDAEDRDALLRVLHVLAEDVDRCGPGTRAEGPGTPGGLAR